MHEMIFKLNRFIEKLNANDIIDILYWAKRFHSSGQKAYTEKYFDLNKMVKRINECIKDR